MAKKLMFLVLLFCNLNICKGTPPICKVRMVMPDKTIWSGTGCVYDMGKKEAFILTNWHVVNHKGKCEVGFWNEAYRNKDELPILYRDGEVLCVDQFEDLACLRINLEGLKDEVSNLVEHGIGILPIYLKESGLSDKSVVSGLKLSAYGCTTGSRDGVVSYFESPKSYGDKDSHFVMNCKCHNGDSGGPVFDNEGKLIGVIFGSIGGEDTHCVRIEAIKKFLWGDSKWRTKLIVN